MFLSGLLNNRAIIFALIIFSVALVGCGGGGSGSPTNPPTNPPITNPPITNPPIINPPTNSFFRGFSDVTEVQVAVFETTEYQNQPGLAMINAAWAYARGARQSNRDAGFGRATGQGVTVGAIDSGLDTTYADFSAQGKVDPASISTASGGSGAFHGTFVSSVAVGARGEMGGQTLPTHGVAFDATLRFRAIGAGDPPEIYNPINLIFTRDDPDFASWFQFHNGASAVVNVSVNFASDPATYTPQIIGTAFSNTIAAIRQSSVDQADRTIYVVAAGNARGRALTANPDGTANTDGPTADASSPEVLAMLTYGAPELQDQLLAVVSVDSSELPITEGVISSFSNRCGLARAWCLAAPGRQVRGADIRTGQTILSSGTSFAAPHVTGAIAVLIDFFGDRLGHHEIVQRLLTTANKSGIYADQAIYGQGLLDLKAATEPVGTTSLLIGTSLAGPSVAASATRLLNGAAFGDAWTNAFRDHVLSVFDELDAPFPVRLTDFVSSPARGLLFDAALSQLGRRDLPHHRVLDNGVSLSFSSSTFLASGAVHLGSLSDRRRWFASYGVHPGLALSEHAQGYSLSPTRTDEFLAPWLGFATDGLSVGAMLPFGSFKLAVAGFDGYQTDEFADDRRSIFNDSEEDHRSRNQGFVLNLTSSGSSSWFGFQLGLVNESSGLVGSSGVGALKLGENMQTWFAGGMTGWTFGSWQAVASAYVGLTQADDEVSGSLFVDMSSLISSTMSFGVMRPDIFSRGDRFSLFITQPLRVESGAAKLRFAVARTRYGDVILSETQADLAPSGREIELEASYFYPLSAASKLTLAAGVIRDRGHEAGAPFEARMMARWQLKF